MSKRSDTYKYTHVYELLGNSVEEFKEFTPDQDTFSVEEEEIVFENLNALRASGL